MRDLAERPHLREIAATGTFFSRVMETCPTMLLQKRGHVVIAIDRQEVIMPGGIEMTRQAERYLDLRAGARLLSVACGTGELELHLAERHGCVVTGIDAGAWAIEKALSKAAARGLVHLARFVIGDGGALPLAAGSCDAVFCSGALCAFFDRGLREFHRVLVPGGRAAILDVIWRRDPVPVDVTARWAGGDAVILTLDGNRQAFRERGFRVRCARAYHEPAWWQAYYDDRGEAPHWRQERADYEADQAYLGLGLFVLEKAL
jgi:SAM-dependent methyltransferase